jgi:hypothetical protein
MNIKLGKILVKHYQKESVMQSLTAPIIDLQVALETLLAAR